MPHFKGRVTSQTKTRPSTVFKGPISHRIKNLIHDQVGFIPQMHGWLDLCKSVNMIHISIIKNYVIISVDVSKAFNET